MRPQLLKHWIISLFVRGSTLADIQQALEDYLPVLLGLVKHYDLNVLTILDNS